MAVKGTWAAAAAANANSSALPGPTQAPRSWASAANKNAPTAGKFAVGVSQPWSAAAIPGGIAGGMVGGMAGNMTGIGGGMNWAAAAMPRMIRLQGALCEWDPARACGFVECVDPPGKRLFTHKSEFLEPFEDGAAPPLGTPVTFVHGLDEKSGKERARQIRVERRHFPARPAPRMYGNLNDWSHEKACGFIDCPEAPGKRFFAHKSEFARPFADGEAPPQGSPVSFVLGIDTKSGKHRAQDIRTDDAVHRTQVGPPRLYGTLDEWDENRACGFIHCVDMPGQPSAAGKRFFAHKTEFSEPFEDGQGPPSGQLVSFTWGVDAKSGKERARDIRIETEGPDEAPPRIQGFLADWKAKSACGFVECYDPPGKRYFAHKSEFVVPFVDGEEPALGTPMSFTAGYDMKSGKERAQQIQIEEGMKHPLPEESQDLSGSPLKRMKSGE